MGQRVSGLLLATFLLASPAWGDDSGSLASLFQNQPTDFTNTTPTPKTMSRPLVLRLQPNLSASDPDPVSLTFNAGKRIPSLEGAHGNSCTITISRSEIQGGVYEKSFARSLMWISDRNPDGSVKSVFITLINGDDDHDHDTGKLFACGTVPAQASVSDVSAIVGPAFLSITPGSAAASDPPPSAQQQRQAGELLAAPQDVTFGGSAPAAVPAH